MKINCNFPSTQRTQMAKRDFLVNRHDLIKFDLIFQKPGSCHLTIFVFLVSNPFRIWSATQIPPHGTQLEQMGWSQENKCSHSPREVGRTNMSHVIAPKRSSKNESSSSRERVPVLREDKCVREITSSALHQIDHVLGELSILSHRSTYAVLVSFKVQRRLFNGPIKICQDPQNFYLHHCSIHKLYNNIIIIFIFFVF